MAMSQHPISLNNSKWKKYRREWIFYNEKLTSQNMPANESPFITLCFGLFLSPELLLAHFSKNPEKKTLSSHSFVSPPPPKCPLLKAFLETLFTSSFFFLPRFYWLHCSWFSGDVTLNHHHGKMVMSTTCLNISFLTERRCPTSNENLQLSLGSQWEVYSSVWFEKHFSFHFFFFFENTFD